MIKFILGVIVGVIVGITIMCILFIAKEEE